MPTRSTRPSNLRPASERGASQRSQSERQQRTTPPHSADELSQLRRGRSRRSSARVQELQRRAARRLDANEVYEDIEYAPLDEHVFDNVVDLNAARRARLNALRHPRTRHEDDSETEPATRTGNKAIKGLPTFDFAARDEAVRDTERSATASKAGTRLDAREKTVQSRVAASCPPCHWGLAILSLLLTLASIPLVYSASTAIALDHHGRPDFFLVRQVMYAGIGAAVLLLSSRLSSRGLRWVVRGLYVITLLGLIATDFTPLGLVMGGVKRWMKIGPIQLQFSELAKIALLGIMAEFWSHAGRNAPRSFGPWLMTAVLALPMVVLVFLQPHLSAASLLFLLPFFVAFYAGCDWKNIAKIAAPLLVGAVVVIALCQTHNMPLLKEYQQDRIASHFGGASEGGEAGNYQSLQGQRALMRGGILGTGPGGSLYKQGHLPAPHTDFILAVIGEEWGMIGVLALLGTYGVMIFFCFHTGHSANNTFEGLLCAGIGTLLGVQVICNVGVVTGVLPVTGMPLPLLSYGGSGMICTLLGLGLVLSVSRRYNCDAGKEAPQQAATA